MLRLLAPVLSLAVAACSGSHVCPDAPAVDLWAVRTAHLDGVWTVYRADESVDGIMVFDGDDVEATSGETRLVGTWQSELADGSVRLRLTFTSAHRPGIDEVWGEPSPVVLDLVFVGPDTLIATQSNGAFTRWTREPPSP